GRFFIEKLEVFHLHCYFSNRHFSSGDQPSGSRTVNPTDFKRINCNYFHCPKKSLPPYESNRIKKYTSQRACSACGINGLRVHGADAQTRYYLCCFESTLKEWRSEEHTSELQSRE